MNFIVPLVVYPFDVMVSIGETDEELGSALEKCDTISPDEYHLANWKGETEDGRAVMFTCNATLIRIRRVPEYPKDYGTIQHEIFHCVSFIMWKIGTPLEIRVSDEPYAYLIEYLTTEIYRKISD